MVFIGITFEGLYKTYQCFFMKKLLFLVSLVSFLSCNSNFDLEPELRQEFTFDQDGDPVIINVENVEEQQLGIGNGFCYGYGAPDAPMAEVEIDELIPDTYEIPDFLPQVRSQGKQGSCVGWATGYYLKSYQENFEDSENSIALNSNEMSPSYVYNQIKIGDCDSGSSIQDALELLSDQGIVDLTEMPYDQNQCDIQPNESQKEQAQVNKIESFYYLNESLVFDQTKAFLLKNQPVVIAVTLDRSYFGAKDGDIYVYRKFKNPAGGHAMLVVGYDDDKQAFKAVNSWGKDWGNNGFVWIDYKAFKEAGNLQSDFPVLCEAWVTNDLLEIQPASL